MKILRYMLVFIPISIVAKSTIQIQLGSINAKITVTPVAKHNIPSKFLYWFFKIPPPI